MDLGFLKAEGADAEPDADVETSLFVADAATRMEKVIPTDSKGRVDYAASGVVGFIKSLRAGKVRLRSDDEPSIIAVANKVKEELPDVVVLETTPKYSLLRAALRRGPCMLFPTS